jgi:signal transduction histidine kinase
LIKRFTIQIVLRIALIVSLCLLLGMFADRANWFTVSGLGLLIGLIVFYLIRYVNQTNYTLVKFLDALKTGDHSVYFSQTKKGQSFKSLFEDFNAILKMFRDNKIAKEAQYEYFRQILEQVPLGIISIRKTDLDGEHKDDEILFLNQAACDILEQPRHKYWHRLVRQVPWLVTQINELSNGGKKLMDLGKDLNEAVLAIEVVGIEFMGTPYLIVTLQDIHTEIEQKEMEAWHNIIRVLAHEMMNSFTPVSSLASTIKSMTEDKSGEVRPAVSLDDETILDINLGASTIQRRAEGLLNFVNDYRTLSNVPVPHIQRVNVKDFCEQVELLMRPTLDEKKIRLKKLNIPPRAIIRVDPGQIEQVFINLIGNSIYALEGRENGLITIQCDVRRRNIALSITDNGKGIPDEIRKNIFVPFYTTRVNGSGIGLSLSKSIMKQHGGNIFVHSEPGKFTTFSLIFPT